MEVRKKPWFAVTVLGAALFLGLVSGVRAGEPKYLWKAATLAPKRVGWSNQVAEILIPAIEKASNGDLGIKIYWGGIMGDDENVIKKMRDGTLQVAGFAAQGAVLACPEIAVVSLPFMFNSYQEVDYIREKAAEQGGFVLFLWIDQDFDQLYSINKPISSLSEFKGVRFVQWYGILEERLLLKLGAKPVPVDVPDISHSMRTGKTEALLGPALWMVGAQMYSVTKYINLAKMRYSPALIMTTTQSWNSVPKAYTGRLWKQRMDICREFVISTRKDNEAALKAMLEYGVIEAGFSPEQMKIMRKETAPIWDEMKGVLYPGQVLEELQDNLARYRKTHSP